MGDMLGNFGRDLRLMVLSTCDPVLPTPGGLVQVGSDVDQSPANFASRGGDGDQCWENFGAASNNLVFYMNLLQ